MKWWATKNPLEAVKSAGLILGLLGVLLLNGLLPVAVIGLMATVSPTLGLVGVIGWSAYVLLMAAPSAIGMILSGPGDDTDFFSWFVGTAWSVLVPAGLIGLAFVVLRSCS